MGYAGGNDAFVTSSSFISGRFLPRSSLFLYFLSFSLFLSSFLSPSLLSSSLLLSLPLSFLPFFHSTKTYWIPNKWTSLSQRTISCLLGLTASRPCGGKTLQQRSMLTVTEKCTLNSMPMNLDSCPAQLVSLIGLGQNLSEYANICFLCYKILALPVYLYWFLSMAIVFVNTRFKGFIIIAMFY